MKTIIWSDKGAVFYKKLSSLVLPIAFQRSMLTAVSASDALMPGSVNRDSLSAVSLAGQVTSVSNLFIDGLTMGTSILAAQYCGKGDMTFIEKTFAYVIRVSFLTPAVFLLATLLVPGILMRIFTNEPQLISSGTIYLRIVTPSYLFIGTSQIYLCVSKDTDYAIKSMVIGSTTVVTNIFLNAVLIYGLLLFPEMGIAGVALATSVSKLVGMGWTYLESLREERAGLRTRYCFITKKNLVRGYWKYTAPVLDDYLVWGCGFTAYSIIMGRLGSDVMAVSSIANIVKNLIVSFCTGLRNSGGIIVGNELSIGNLKRAEGYGGRLCRLAVISGVLSGVFLVALTPVIVKVTILSPQATGYLKWMLIPRVCYVAGKLINMTTIAKIFPIGRDSKSDLICDTATMWTSTVPAGFLVAFVWDLSVVIVFPIINLGEIVKLLAAILHYRKYGWLKDLTR